MDGEVLVLGDKRCLGPDGMIRVISVGDDLTRGLGSSPKWRGCWLSTEWSEVLELRAWPELTGSYSSFLTRRPGENERCGDEGAGEEGGRGTRRKTQATWPRQ